MWEKINHAGRWRGEIGRIEKKGKNNEGRGGSHRRVFLAKKEGEEEEKRQFQHWLGSTVTGENCWVEQRKVVPTEKK